MSAWTLTVAQTERGWDDGGYDDAGNSLPKTCYPNAYKAAARMLQLMEIGTPVEPQNYPERVELGRLAHPHGTCGPHTRKDFTRQDTGPATNVPSWSLTPNVRGEAPAAHPSTK